MYTGIILVFLPRLRNFSNIALFYQCRQNRKLRLSFQEMLWTFFFVRPFVASQLRLTPVLDWGNESSG